MTTRRLFLAGAAGLAAQQAPISPDPTDRDWTGVKPIKYPDPDVIALTPAFRKYMVGNTSMKKLHTGTSWAEGPAWNGVGKYMVWSDIPANLQLRFVDDDARVTVFRNPAGYSNEIGRAHV